MKVPTTRTAMTIFSAATIRRTQKNVRKKTKHEIKENRKKTVHSFGPAELISGIALYVYCVCVCDTHSEAYYARRKIKGNISTSTLIPNAIYMRKKTEVTAERRRWRRKGLALPKEILLHLQRYYFPLFLLQSNNQFTSVCVCVCAPLARALCRFLWIHWHRLISLSRILWRERRYCTKLFRCEANGILYLDQMRENYCQICDSLKMTQCERWHTRRRMKIENSINNNPRPVGR